MNKQNFVEHVKQLDDSYIYELYLNYCDSNGYAFDIRSMAEFDGALSAQTPTEIVRLTNSDKFCIYDEYFTESYNGLVSFDRLDDEKSPIDFDALANWLVDQDNEIYTEWREENDE